MTTSTPDTADLLAFIEQEISSMTVPNVVAFIDSKAPGFAVALRSMIDGHNAHRLNKQIDVDAIADAVELFPFLDRMFPELCEHVCALMDSELPLAS
jgi:hypothetical protein